MTPLASAERAPLLTEDVADVENARSAADDARATASGRGGDGDGEGRRAEGWSSSRRALACVALSSAAARGVLVQLVLPARNDSLMANHASNSFMEDLLAAGVDIYRYDAGLLHTKSVLVDDDFALVGTVNLDRRSLWLNFEITLLIDNPVFVAEMNQLVQGYMLEATPMSLTQWRARPWYKKLLENIFYLFSPLL